MKGASTDAAPDVLSWEELDGSFEYSKEIEALAVLSYDRIPYSDTTTSNSAATELNAEKTPRAPSIFDGGSFKSRES